MFLPTKNNRIKLTLVNALTCCFLLVGCDQGDSNKELERELAAKDGDARATGSACRQAGRALEDCYNLNPTAQRAFVFAGWRDMNDYMRENKIAEVKPTAEAPKAADTSGTEDAGKKVDK